MSSSLTNDLEQLPADSLRLARCQIDVSFPPGYKTGPQPHCPWFRECNGSPQIIEVKDTGWETYHFKTVADATRFAEMTRQRAADGGFAGGRLPHGSEVTIQQRATLEIVRDFVVST